MTTYAIAETVPEDCDYLTAGKRYEVLGDNGSGLFDIVDDGGGQVTCLWRGCAHLHNGNWTRVEEDGDGNAPDDPAYGSGRWRSDSCDHLASFMEEGPAHYTDLPIEPWEIMEANFTRAEFEGFLKGNVLKYLLRYQGKGGLEDVRKAKHYLVRLEQLLETPK